MYCPKCGRKFPEGTKFCGACGEKLIADPREESAPISEAEENAQENQAGQFVKSIPGKVIHRQKAVFGVVVGVAACLVLVVGVYGGSVASGAQARDGMEVGTAYMDDAQYGEALAAIQDVIGVDPKGTVVATDDNQDGASDNSLQNSSELANADHEDRGTETIEDIIDANTAQAFLETFSGSMFAMLEDWYANGNAYDTGNMDGGQAYSIAALSFIGQEGDLYSGGVTTFCYLNSQLYVIETDDTQENAAFVNAVQLASLRFASDVEIEAEQRDMIDIKPETTSVADLNAYLAELGETAEVTVYDVGNDIYRVEITLPSDSEEGSDIDFGETFHEDTEYYFITSVGDPDFEKYIQLNKKQRKQYEKLLTEKYGDEYPLDAFSEFENETYGCLMRKDEEENQFYLKVLSEEEFPPADDEVTVEVLDTASEPDADGSVAIVAKYSRKKGDSYCVRCHIAPDEDGYYLTDVDFDTLDQGSDAPLNANE